MNVEGKLLPVLEKHLNPFWRSQRTSKLVWDSSREVVWALWGLQQGDGGVTRGSQLMVTFCHVCFEQKAKRLTW